MSNEPPKVYFGHPSDKPMPHLGWAYLIWVGGQAWAFADRAEIHKKPQDANAAPLDEKHLQEVSSGEAGQTVWVYTAAPAFPRSPGMPR